MSLTMPPQEYVERLERMVGRQSVTIQAQGEMIAKLLSEQGKTEVVSIPQAPEMHPVDDITGHVRLRAVE